MNNKRLGHILLEQGYIEASALDFCLNIQRNNGNKRIGEILRHYNFVREDVIMCALAKQVGWSVLEEDFILHRQAFDQLGISFLKENNIFPHLKDGKLILIVSVTDNIALSDQLSKRFNNVTFALASSHKITQQLLLLEVKARNIISSQDDDINIWFERCLHSAIEKGATDIHIEPSEKAVEVRERIDGLLHFKCARPLKDLPKIINIIFHKADITVSDFARFHDARFSYIYFERAIDIRLSHIPSTHGSSVVLRLLDKRKSVLDLTELGFGERQWCVIENDLRKPDGIMLVVGPTGSGKSTSLYAMINHIKDLSKKIVSIEDPVEVHMPLMTQVQINEKRGVHFHESIRSFLRHDPDVMLIGEIRDGQTAAEAMRASMTGHKVFTTLHTKRCVDALLRLHDLGVAWITLANNITLIMSQRLIRKLCSFCKQFVKDGQYINNSQGCNQCVGGYSGRCVISEVLVIDEALGLLIAKGDIVAVMAAIKERKNPTLVDDAMRLVHQGLTSIDELERVLG